MKIYNSDNFEVSFKNDDSPLTIADKNANDIIISYLIKTGIPIISEENKQTDYNTRKNWDSCWIVDPLDGTKEFVKRNGEFTVNIALIKKQKPVLGIIYVPVTKELFIGNVIEKCAHKVLVNNHFNTENYNHANNRISTVVKNTKENKPLRIVGSRSHMNNETKSFVKELDLK